MSDIDITAVLEQLTNADAPGDINGVKFEITRRGPGGTGDETTVKGTFYRADEEEFKSGLMPAVDAALVAFDRIATHRHPLTEEED